VFLPVQAHHIGILESCGLFRLDQGRIIRETSLQFDSEYQFGAVVCILLLYPTRQALSRWLRTPWLVLLLSYLINAVAVTSIELVVGLIANHPDASGHLIYWDYSNLPFNFMGQICLQNALAFGLVATVMVWFIFPELERFFLCRSDDTMNVLFVSILSVYLLLAALYLVNLSYLTQTTVEANATVAAYGSAPLLATMWRAHKKQRSPE
ncbi:MAG: putative ABC transporter permease, partial [Coriobacteriales bacterium]|nr:putative ABC transporter permease [Coriobacteriales bacterium]